MSFYLQEQVLSLGNDFYRFYQTKNRYDKAGMINLMKNTHPLYGKTTPGKKSRKWLPLVKRKTQLRLMPPNFNYGLQQQKKRPWSKECCFHTRENKFPPAGMKHSLKNAFSLDVKVTFDINSLTFSGSNIWKKIGENGFH